MTGFYCTKRLQDLRVSLSLVDGQLGHADDGPQCQIPGCLGNLRFDSTQLPLCLAWATTLLAMLKTSRVQEEQRIQSFWVSAIIQTAWTACITTDRLLSYLLSLSHETRCKTIELTSDAFGPGG